MWKYTLGTTSVLFLVSLVYTSAVAQSPADSYVLPVVLVYPKVWADKNTVPPTIEIRVLDQTTEEDLLEAAEGDEAEALDTEASVRYFNIAKSDVTAGEDIDVCISAVGTNDYPDLAKCKKATVGDEEFPGLAVFIIE